MECTAFNHAAWNSLHSIGIHCTMMHRIHCVQSKSIAPHCMESTAFNRDVWAMLYKIHCIQSRCIWPRCMDSTAHNCDPLRHNEWNTLHSMTLHGFDCIQSGCILPGCIESMHSSHCTDSTAYNWDPLRHNAWNPLHSIRMLWAMLHKIHCIQSCSIKSTAFNQAA